MAPKLESFNGRTAEVDLDTAADALLAEILQDGLVSAGIAHEANNDIYIPEPESPEAPRKP